MLVTVIFRYELGSSFSFPPFASSSRFLTPVHPSTRWTADYKGDGPYDELLWEIDEPGGKEEVSREVVHGEVADEEAGKVQVLQVLKEIIGMGLIQEQ